jgi:hypothetical protein
MLEPFPIALNSPRLIGRRRAIPALVLGPPAAQTLQDQAREHLFQERDMLAIEPPRGRSARCRAQAVRPVADLI